jgi:uncharacterized LabA/DUF88 family protein
MANAPATHRVIAYIDGFNLYFGLRESGWRRYYWLNIKALAQSLLKPNQVLVGTKYFTARISGARPGDSLARGRERDASRQRQCDFLDALGTLPHFRIYEGHFLDKTMQCLNCKRTWGTYEEKMTDVQIATEMLTDAFEDRFDMALLISGDSDLVPPIRSIRRLFADKRVIVVFPPARSSEQLKRAATANFVIGEAKLRKSQFPDEVRLPNGYVLRRPPSWR